MGNVARCRTGAYQSWYHMIRRCYVPSASGYEHWGGRGIRVCARWHTFDNFIKDMGPRPPKHSIDRINNNGNYEPSNCRWTTAAIQLRNSRRNVWYTFHGETLTLQDWSKKLGLGSMTLAGRIRRGWPLEIALTRPARYGDRVIRGDHVSRGEDAKKAWRTKKAQKGEA